MLDLCTFCQGKRKMTLIHAVIFWIFLKAGSCQRRCVIETLDDAEFSITVADRQTVASGECITIKYEFTLPTNKVTAPYKKTWFERDPSNIVSTNVVNKVESETKTIFTIDGLPRGEYEYGFKLEWGCNQTYIFPKRVQISVSALTQEPVIDVTPMEVGSVATLLCYARRLCSRTSRPSIHWERTNADGQSTVINDDDEEFHFFLHRNSLRFVPTKDDHNTNITCVAKYNYGIVETTVTLDVKFAPEILNDSQCVVQGALLICLCISRGNPLPPITWPLTTLTDYSVSSSSSSQTVNSTITMPAADYRNTTVKCISSNEVGQAKTEIPLQKYTKNFSSGLASNQRSDAVVPWIIAGVSISLNLVLLMICAYKWRNSQQKEPGEEVNMYASLNVATLEQPYSVIY